MNYFFTLLIISCLHLLLRCDQVFAEIEVITLEEVISQALEKSPVTATIKSKTTSSKSEGLILKALPNPQFDSEVRFPLSQDEDRGDNEINVSLSQPLKVSHFGRREQVNRLIVNAAEATQALELLELSQRIRLLYGKVWALSERAAQIDSFQKKARNLFEQVHAGVTKGLFNSGEEAIFESEEKRLKAEKLGVIADLQGAQAELTRITGTAFEQKSFRQPLIQVITDNSLDPNSALPVQEKTRLFRQLAEEQSRLARLDRYPEFAPRIIYEHSAEGREYLGVGVSFQLPLFDRNQGQRSKVEAEAHAAQSTAAYYTSELFNSELRALHRGVQAASEQYRIFNEEVLPLLKTALDLHQAQLQAGQGTVLQGWQVLRSLNEASAQSVELFVRLLSLHVELSILLGKEV